MATFMKVNGKITNVTEKVYTRIPIVPSMMEIGKTMSNEDVELKPGLTVLPTKENIEMERKMDMGNSNGQIIVIL